MKRVLSVQDLSCVGKCSLGEALPVLSAMGVEACALPTAVLSAHTAFSNITRVDLTDRLPGVLSAWSAESLQFDAISSGYLGAKEQILLVRDLWEHFGRKNCLRLCDPAMGDAGELYRGFDASHVAAVRELVKEADVVLPNVTEVCLLLGEPWRENLTEEQEQQLVLALADKIRGSVIMTGYRQGESGLGAACYDRQEDRFYAFCGRQLPGNYYGTGDLFSAVVTGALVQGRSMSEAVRLAVEFTSRSIEKTLEDPEARWYGTDFERVLPWLCQQMQERD
jgi:pyridoxine kinase